MPVSIKLPERLKRRVKKAAAQQAVSAHAFMLAAIEAETGRAEARAAFVAEALEAQAEATESDTWYAAEEVLEYARELAAGKPARPPAPLARRR